MNLPGGVALAVVSGTRVEASVLRMDVGDGEGVVVADTGPAISTLSSNNWQTVADYIPLHHGLLLARQGSAA